ncbi:MAG: chemotaxis protein CheB [Elusimicrobiota bacterium]
MRAVKSAGGGTIGQDGETSAVFGMSRAAI